MTHRSHVVGDVAPELHEDLREAEYVSVDLAADDGRFESGTIVWALVDS